MPKRAFGPWLVVLVLLGSGEPARSKDDFMPDATPKAAVPVPLEPVDVRGLNKLASENHDTLWLLEKVQRENGEALARFKTLSVEGDQEAGILFRYSDPKNFYAVVANAKDESCVLYRVKDGSWSKEGMQDAIVTPLTWHELRVIFTPEGVTALLDGQLTLGMKMSSVKSAGGLGLWAKVGSRVNFDKFQISRQ